MSGENPDTNEILARCTDGVPVGAPLSAAIAAHEIATEQRNRELIFYAIRAVLMARVLTIDDLRRQRDYLEALPLAAWSGVGWDAARARREGLAMVDANIRAAAN